MLDFCNIFFGPIEECSGFGDSTQGL